MLHTGVNRGKHFFDRSIDSEQPDAEVGDSLKVHVPQCTPSNCEVGVIGAKPRQIRLSKACSPTFDLGLHGHESTRPGAPCQEVDMPVLHPDLGFSHETERPEMTRDLADDFGFSDG